MTRALRREGESFESLLKRFRKQVAQERILSTVRKKRYFVPKSEQRRRARKKAVHRARQLERRQKRMYGAA